MKKFIQFLGKLLIVLVLASVVLDLLYTFVYARSKSRTKIDYLYTSKNLNYDVVFLGSSRVANHFVPEIFNKNGLKSYNFGLTRSRLEESALMLKLMIERNYKIKTLVLQVDLNINSNDHSEAIRSLFMPYLHQSKIIRNHYKNIAEFKELLYVPFYRYMNYDARIGFREFVKSALHEKTNALDNDGFYTLKTNQRPMIAADLSKYYPKKNKGYDEIKAICKKNNIHLIAITTPICTETINRSYFKKIKQIYPEVCNFEDSVVDQKYFSTCGHLNKAGAIEFTTKFYNAFFKNKIQN